jgi:hypothetical protein
MSGSSFVPWSRRPRSLPMASITLASAWKLGPVNVGKPIHGAAANAVKSMGFPNPRWFASNTYSRYPPMAPKMIGNLRQIPGARTEQRDRLEAGGFLRQPRNAPLKAYNGDAITHSDWAWTSSRYNESLTITFC